MKYEIKYKELTDYLKTLKARKLDEKDFDQWWWETVFIF